MSIPPCTSGKHSNVEEKPEEPTRPTDAEIDAKIKAQSEKKETPLPPVSRVPIAAQILRDSPAPEAEEEDEDDLGTPVPKGASCKRRACGSSYKEGQDRNSEECTHHPGQAIFHEGSKGWTCCKRRVLEFDEFMKIPGCKTKPRHLYVGKKKGVDSEEVLKDVRNDFYQTATTVIASLYLKKIDKDRSKVIFSSDGKEVDLDLHTSDHKQYRSKMALYSTIKPDQSQFKIMGTKLELTLAKADGTGWPVLKADDPHTGEIIQAGRAGRV